MKPTQLKGPKVMQNLGKIFISILLLVTFSQAIGVKATVNTTNINRGEKVILRLEANGDNVKFPFIYRISGVRVDSRSTYKSTNLGYSNGRIFIDRRETLELSFTPQANIVIPAFGIIVDGKKLMTSPIVINVRNVGPQINITNVNSDISIDMIAAKKSLYVGESLMVSVFVYKKIGVDILSMNYTKPSFDGFLSREIGKEKTVKQGPYNITQMDYLLTPQIPGNYTVYPAKATVVTKNRTSNSFFDIFFKPKPKTQNISSKMLSIIVKPLPTPAQLVGDFNISVKPSTMVANANTPVVLALKIDGEGVLDDFDGLDYNTSGLTIYSNKPQITLGVTGTKIRSNYIKEYVFVSDHDFVIPSRNITMFNTKTKKIQTITTPSYDIKVIDDKSSNVSTFMASGFLKETMPSMFWLIVSFIVGIFSMALIWFVVYRKENKKKK